MPRLNNNGGNHTPCDHASNRQLISLRSEKLAKSWKKKVLLVFFLFITTDLSNHNISMNRGSTKLIDFLKFIICPWHTVQRPSHNTLQRGSSELLYDIKFDVCRLYDERLLDRRLQRHQRTSSTCTTKVTKTNQGKPKPYICLDLVPALRCQLRFYWPISRRRS